MSDNNGYTWRDHSRLFLACGIVILSPFQYGFDFGMIGGLQAMVGFLKVQHEIRFQDCMPNGKYRSLAIAPTKHPQDGTLQPSGSNSSPHS
jgi:hypothetical protein